MRSPITLVDYKHPEKYKKARTEFIMFVKDGDFYHPSLPVALYQVYEDNPLFRKLSMVAPAMTTSFSVIYGWTISDGIATPKYAPSSTEPYAIQVGSVTGSVIRRAALDRIDYKFTGDRLRDSVNLSMALWNGGQMCYIAPSVFLPSSPDLDTPTEAPSDPDVQKLFKRELIG